MAAANDPKLQQKCLCQITSQLLPLQQEILLLSKHLWLLTQRSKHSEIGRQSCTAQRQQFVAAQLRSDWIGTVINPHALLGPYSKCKSTQVIQRQQHRLKMDDYMFEIYIYLICVYVDTYI